MLLTLLYHGVGVGKYANSLPLLQEHLELVRDRYTSHFPGEKLQQNAICLTFDDALFDFYHLIFPLLKQLALKAVVAVPVKYIQEQTTLAPEERLGVPLRDVMKDSVYPFKVPHCTWKELREMVQTGLVRIASHSWSHPDLTSRPFDPQTEIILSKKILEEKLQSRVDTFIYPYGKVNRSVHKIVRQHYPYAMRIGSALNWNWKNRKGLLYRVSGDRMPAPDQPLKRKARLQQTGRLILNTLLNK